MRKRKWLGLILLLPVIWLALVATHALPRPEPGDAAVLAALKADSPNLQGERNAFAALQNFGHEVPESEWEAVAAADVAAFDKLAPGTALEAFTTAAEGKYPAYATIANSDPALCNSWGSECLLKIRGNLDAARTIVANSAKQLEHGEKLLGYDHYRYGFTPRIDSPIAPVGGYFPLLLTSVALLHIDGDSAGAFDRLCRHAAGWRRLRAHTDLMIMDMLGIAIVTGASRLYAEMLVEMPADFVAPCPQVFAPLADAELDQCAIARLEFHSMENSLEALSPEYVWPSVTGGSRPFSQPLAGLINPEHTKMLFARSAARLCSDEQHERIRKRSAAALPAPALCGVSAWTFDPLGCWVSGAAIDYDPYYRRLLDFDARLKLLSSVIFLRGKSADAAKAAFDARPESLRSPEHEMSIDPRNGTLRLMQLEKFRGNPWVLPYAQAEG